MNTPKTAGQHAGLVVTPNFVEAEDIADGLKQLGVLDVAHYRASSAALDALRAQRIGPSVALVSFDRCDTDVAPLVETLLDQGARVVVVNGNPAFAERFGVAHLQRPFTSSELEHCVQGAMAGQ